MLICICTFDEVATKLRVATWLKANYLSNEGGKTMDKTTKQEIIAKYARKEGDTGSPEVQIALFTARNFRAHRTPQESPQGSSQPSRSSYDGRSQKKSSQLSQRDGHREISCNRICSWFEKVKNIGCGLTAPVFFGIIAQSCGKNKKINRFCG